MTNKFGFPLPCVWVTVNIAGGGMANTDVDLRVPPWVKNAEDITLSLRSLWAPHPPACPINLQKDSSTLGPGMFTEKHTSREPFPRDPLNFTLLQRVERDGSGECPDLVDVLSPCPRKGHFPQPPGTEYMLFSEQH